MDTSACWKNLGISRGQGVTFRYRWIRKLEKKLCVVLRDSISLETTEFLLTDNITFTSQNKTQ